MLFLFFTLFNLSWASEVPSCRAKTPMPAVLTPESLRGWLGGNGNLIRNPGDFICCLPAEYRSTDFISIHSSIAGQNGTPKSPRVILHLPPTVNLSGEDGTDKNLMAFTINGGEPDMFQSDEVEIMNYQTKSGSFDLFDLRKVPGDVYMISEANPKACMRCHGESSGRVPKHGPRPLFDEDPWHRIVGGAMKCNPEQDKLQYLKSKKALEAIRDNPRFACLDKSSLLKSLKALKDRNDNIFSNDHFRNQNHSIASFDHLLFVANYRRVEKMISDSPNYNAYKYIIAGSEFCGVVSNLEKWMPAKIIEQHSNLNFLTGSSAILTASDLKRRRSQLKSEASTLRRKQREEVLDKNKTDSEPIVPGASVYSCPDNELIQKVEASEDQALKIKNPVLRAYSLDRVPSATVSELNTAGFPGILRFLFEARGIHISDWSRDLGRGQYQDIGFITAAFMYSKSDAELSALSKPLVTHMESYKPSKDYRKERIQIQKKVCENLQLASFEALSKISIAPPASDKKNKADSYVK